MNTENNCLLDAQLTSDSYKLRTTSNTISSLRLSETISVVQTTTSNRVELFSNNCEITYESNIGWSDDLFSMAIKCRTADGSVDPFGNKLLLDKLEEIANTEEALVEFTKVACGGIQIKLVKNAGGGARGRSEATIYFVHDISDTIVAVCKIFPKNEELVRELSSLSRLREPEFTHFKIPAPLAAAKIKVNTNYVGVLVSEIARGQSIADLIDSMREMMTINERDNVFSQLLKAVTETARAFAQLHRQPCDSRDSALKSYLISSINRTRHLTLVLDKEYTHHQDIVQLNINKVQLQLEQLIAECQNEHSYAAIVHGDAHPGNLFWDSTAGVTFIDTQSLHSSMDSKGKPIGTPERDIASFGERFVTLCRKSGIHEDNINLLYNTFWQEYHVCNGVDLSENKLKFFAVRFLLGELVQACNNKHSEDIKAAIVSLKQVLG
ncbi:hypothetical protein I4U23_016619 [Adineta vaga]|nr:hypothetical protein I4U23_016619 [Adineta vaga]